VEEYRQENNLRYDLILSHYWLSGQAGRALQLKWDVPHIVMFHTIGAIKNTLVVGEPEPELRLETEKQLTHGCCYIISATAQEKRALVAHYGAKSDRVFVIPCGVNMETFRPVDKIAARRHIGFDGDKLIVFIGRIEALKGIDQLIKAIPLLPKGLDVRLNIVGGDEYSRPEIERLTALARSLGIADKVAFPGLVKQDQLLYHYSAADVCVSPSYYESFGLTPLESLACGTPVVATDVGAARNIIRKEIAGYVVPQNAPRVLADKIAQVLARQPISGSEVQQIRGSISGFAWEKTARASLRICRRAVAEYSAVPS
jgi:D-inositol-3-phosphate glycosyltransferase